jgi:hypothetical protein
MRLAPVSRHPIPQRPDDETIRSMRTIEHEVREQIRGLVASGVPAEKLADSLELRYIGLAGWALTKYVQDAWDAVESCDRMAAAEVAFHESTANEHILTLTKDALADGFDPSGFFVYLLYAEDADRPVYVGKSTNLMARLGAHMTAQDRRHRIRTISIIRCKTELSMNITEGKLIERHQPELNVQGVRRAG